VSRRIEKKWFLRVDFLVFWLFRFVDNSWGIDSCWFVVCFVFWIVLGGSTVVGGAVKFELLFFV